jgi:hypothetical protein
MRVVAASAYARRAPIAGQPAATVAAATEPKKRLRERVFMPTSSYYIEIVDINSGRVGSQVLAPCSVGSRRYVRFR